MYVYAFQGCIHLYGQTHFNNTGPHFLHHGKTKRQLQTRLPAMSKARPCKATLDGPCKKGKSNSTWSTGCTSTTLCTFYTCLPLGQIKAGSLHRHNKLLTCAAISTTNASPVATDLEDPKGTSYGLTQASERLLTRWQHVFASLNYNLGGDQHHARSHLKTLPAPRLTAYPTSYTTATRGASVAQARAKFQTPPPCTQADGFGGGGRAENMSGFYASSTCHL